MLWHLSDRGDPIVRPLADRHYNRQSLGSTNFAPPGRALILYTKTSGGEAFWITSFQYRRYVKHLWPGAWVCSAFRNEGAALSSLLIREAVSATRHYFGLPPPYGMITFVDRKRIVPKDQPGWCFIKAGFVQIGLTKDELVVLQLLPEKMPCPTPPLPSVAMKTI